MQEHRRPAQQAPPPQRDHVHQGREDEDQSQAAGRPREPAGDTAHLDQPTAARTRPAWFTGVSSRGRRRHLCPPVNQSSFIWVIISGRVLLPGVCFRAELCLWLSGGRAGTSPDDRSHVWIEDGHQHAGSNHCQVQHQNVEETKDTQEGLRLDRPHTRSSWTSSWRSQDGLGPKSEGGGRVQTELQGRNADPCVYAQTQHSRYSSGNGASCGWRRHEELLSPQLEALLKGHVMSEKMSLDPETAPTHHQNLEHQLIFKATGLSGFGERFKNQSALCRPPGTAR